MRNTSYIAAYDRLPEYCFAVNPETGERIRIDRGEMGYAVVKTNPAVSIDILKNRSASPRNSARR